MIKQNQFSNYARFVRPTDFDGGKSLHTLRVLSISVNAKETARPYLLTTQRFVRLGITIHRV